jgi:hypothetical protein
VLKQKRPIDFLDVNTAVLDRLDRAGDLHEFARGRFGIGKRAGGGVFHPDVPIRAGSNSGRTSAPRRPQALQENRGSKSAL